MWTVANLIFSPLAISIFGLGFSILRNADSRAQIDYLDVNEYTDDEKRTIKLFREVMDEELVQKYHRSDDYLIRWLRDSDMDINSASQMLRHNLEWRKIYQMDSVLNNTAYNLEGAPCAIVGFDKIGDPILVIKLMTIDLKNLLTTSKMDKLRNQAALCIERYIEASIRNGSKNDGIRMTPGTAIVDLRGISIKQHTCLACIQLYKDIAVYSSQYYPRNSKNIVLINAPRFSKPVIEMARPFLSQYFQQTLHVFGPDKEEWTRFLLNIIPKEELFQEYGGTKLNSDF